MLVTSLDTCASIGLATVLREARVGAVDFLPPEVSG